MYSSELRIYRILQILPDLRENCNVVAAPPYEKVFYAQCGVIQTVVGDISDIYCAGFVPRLETKTDLRIGSQFLCRIAANGNCGIICHSKPAPFTFFLFFSFLMHSGCLSNKMWCRNYFPMAVVPIGLYMQRCITLIYVLQQIHTGQLDSRDLSFLTEWNADATAWR